MKKKTGIIVGIIVLIIVALGIYTSKDGSKVEDNKGKTITVTDRKGDVTVPYKPERVVVLDYASIDIMNEMGVEPIALPKKSLPSYLEKYKGEKYIDLGSLKEFDMEKINEVKPDLIIIEGRQEDAYDELSKIAPVVFLGTQNNDHFASLEKNLDVLGKVFGQESLAKEKLGTINNRVTAIKNKVIEDKSTALVSMVSEGANSVFGAGSRYGMVFNEFGFTPADENIEVSGHGQNVSNEYLKEKDARYLFVIDRGAVVGGTTQSAKDVIENELVKTTTAYKEGNIIYVNPQAWYVGGAGLQSTDVIISEIEEAIK
ncbi:siderophore ABC transporter substrate-binding protein [Clostridium sp.]|uniref:siderophore ABC transporter substrate-binding protein n=1 Tax=Clostridium sp. TaxID=1506 RepID=UPI002631F569|nr:siderophore ABC transporter substrate-binding protein [Clostridium sp.]